MKPLLSGQPVTQKGERPSNELVQIIQGIVSGFNDLGPLASLTPTGTANSTTYLRGDGTWFDPFFRGQLVARVNFNGTGTVAIRSSANVVSVSDNGPGDYTLNFFTPLTDVNYVVLITPGGTAGVTGARTADDLTARTTSGVRILTTTDAGTPADAAWVHVAVFR